MVVVQHASRLFDVHCLLAFLSPGDFKHRVKIAADHRGLGRAEGLLFQVRELLAKFFVDFLADRQRIEPCTVVVVILSAVFTELGLDKLEFLAQIVFAVIAVHLFRRGRVELLLDAHDLDLVGEQAVKEHQAAREHALL